MAFLRGLLAAAVLLTALLVLLTVMPWIHLPGATPDLLTVSVAALGLAGGPVKGSIAGFAGGLMLDLAPPASGVLGMSAVVLTIVGYLAGEFGQRRQDRPALVTLGFVALLTGGSVVAYAALGVIVGDPRIDWNRLPLLTITSTLYAAVLAAFVVPVVGGMVRRLDPVQPRYDVGRYER